MTVWIGKMSARTMRAVVGGQSCKRDWRAIVAPVWFVWCETLDERAGVVPVRGGRIKDDKGTWWMPWHREAMKDVARCEKPRGAASKR